MSSLPGARRLGALLAGDSRSIGLGYAGYKPMAVASADGSSSPWMLRYANGPKPLAPVEGKCPLGGYPAGFLDARVGALVMTLSYAGDIEVSRDGGATWRVVYRSPFSFLTATRSSGVLWALGVGPAARGVRIVYSANGERGTGIRTPPL